MAEAPTVIKPRLKQLYDESYRPELVKELGLDNLHEAPSLEKIIISVGLGRAKDDKRLLEVAANTLRKISGQQPIETAAKQAIAGFKLREGAKIGLKVSLRGNRMYEFADRLINIVLPRLRDFHGLKSNSFDKIGNYSLGFEDQTVFPELSFEDIATPHGLQVIFVVKAKRAGDSRLLLEKMGLPFEKPASPGLPKKENDG